jgi:hypothetical protein
MGNVTTLSLFVSWILTTIPKTKLKISPTFNVFVACNQIPTYSAYA